MEVFADQNFIMTDERYNSGVMLEEYNGTYSLVNSWMSNAGEAVMKWGYIEKDKKPGKKLPWKIELGTKEHAMEVLKGIARLLAAEPEGPEELPDHNSQQDEPGPQDDMIPF